MSQESPSLVISCSDEDLNQVIPIADKLKDAGINIWINGVSDPDSLMSIQDRPHSQQKETFEAISNCTLNLWICSSTSIKDRKLKAQIQFAHQLEKPHIKLWLGSVNEAERVKFLYWIASVWHWGDSDELAGIETHNISFEEWWPRLLQSLQLSGFNIKSGAYPVAVTLPESKVLNWEKVHIFISSTFNDMHAERDYLVKQVFPQLREWCERRKLHMVDIDLRWGVTEADATQNKNVIKVCLNRIDECRPFFLCFLGQRYGWIPGQGDISDDTIKNYPGLEEAVNKGASVTELEIIHSAISPLHSQETIDNKGYHRAEFAYFFLRDEMSLNSLPSEPAYLNRIYSDTAEKDKKERERLQIRRQDLLDVIKKESSSLHIYKAQWLEDSTTPEIMLPYQCPASLEENQARWRKNWRELAGLIVSHLDVFENDAEAEKARDFNRKLSQGRLGNFQSEGKELGDVVLDDLKKAIETRFPHHRELEDTDDLQKERDQQEQFVFLNSEGFVRRQGDFSGLDEYVEGDSRKLYVLTAEAGLGKSTLLSNWVDQYRRRNIGKPDHFVLFRFIGASDLSTNVYSLLFSLLSEMKDVSGRIYDEIPQNPSILCKAFPELLKIVGLNSKTVIVIDALNQLESGLSDLDWLPRELPVGVKIIVSFKREGAESEELCHTFAADDRIILDELQPFNDTRESWKLVEAYLSQYLKELEERYIRILVDSPATRNPLYLKIVLSELRVFGSFENLGEKIKTDFGLSPQTAFNGVLNRLESDPAYTPIPSEKAVPLIFGLLAHSRHGLTIMELTGLINQALGFKDSKANRDKAADTAYFFLRQIRPFLSLRSGRYDFFYESFRSASLERYVADIDEEPRRTSQSWHRLLGEYYFGLPAEEDSDRKKPNRRRLSETCYHLVRAKEWDRLVHILTDLKFVSSKCREGMVYDLIAEYQEALQALPEAQEERRIEWEREERMVKYIEGLITSAREGKEVTDIPASVRPWGEEELAEQKNPFINGSIPSRVERLKAYSQFVNTESHGMTKFKPGPGYCLQQAYNSTLRGVIADAANDLISRGSSDLLLLVHPSQRLEFNPHPAILRTLEHEEEITCAAMTPDGKRALSGGNYGELRLWDLETGECLKLLEGHTGHLRSVDITPDGKIAFSADEDQDNRVWNLSSYECTKNFESKRCLIDVNIQSDGRRAVSGNSQGMLALWDLKSGECLRELEGHERLIKNVKILPNGKFAVSASEDQTVRLWNLESGECHRIFEGHTDFVTQVSITPDMTKAISASLDKTLRLWNVKTGKCLRTFEHGRQRAFRTAAITPDGKRAVSGTSDGSIQLWDLEQGEMIRELKVHSWGNSCLCLTAEGTQALSAGSETRVRLLDLEKGTFPMQPEKTGQYVVISTDEKRTVSGAEDKLYLLDPEKGTCLRKFEKKLQSEQKEGFRSDNFIEELCVTPDGKTAVSRDRKDKDFLVWDLETEKPPDKIQSHEGAVKCLAVTPDGRRIISGSQDRTLRIWDIATRKLLRTLPGHEDAISKILITHDGRRALSGSFDDLVRVWDIETGKLCGTYQGKLNQLTPDDNGVLLTRDGVLEICQIKTGENLKKFEGLAGFSSCTITPDGKIAVSTKKERFPNVLTLRDGKKQKSLVGHADQVNCVSFTPDGKRAVTGSRDWTLRAWDLTDSECIGSFPGIEEVTSISRIHPKGFFSFGSEAGRILHMKPINLVSMEPVVTPVIMWLYAEEDSPGCWEEGARITCPWCGKRYPVGKKMFDTISGISRNANLSPDQSPCLSLPDEAWNEKSLLSHCALCKNPLRINPFIIDNRDRT